MSTRVCLFFIVLINTCSAQYKLKLPFDSSLVPPEPLYSDLNHWAALPGQKDAADKVPRKSGLTEDQKNAVADVFFIHPTTYTYQPRAEGLWNGSLQDSTLNQKVDATTILNQATVFNGSCRVFAPRYRQAHYSAFTTLDPEYKKKSLDVAYADVRAAFEHYLRSWNQGRPIVIAAHSQGTLHAGRLLKEFFEEKPLQKQLVVAYLIGIAIPKDYFEHISLSSKANDIGTWVSWNTFQKGYYPDYYEEGLNKAACINPLSWSQDEKWINHELNKGAVGYNFTFKTEALGARCHKGMLWIEKPRILGRVFLRKKIWHFADINLFWNNLRTNVALRIKVFEAQKSLLDNEE